MTRDAYVIGPMTTGFFAVMPVGEFLIWLWLMVAAEVAVALVLHRDYRARPIPALIVVRDEKVMRVLRRIVPHLRSRRPQPVIEAQLRWRQTAEARRRTRAYCRKAS
jgi:hypothetical protein